MPKYTFICSSCSDIRHIYTAPRVLDIECPTCLAKMERQLPVLNGPANVKEVVDKNTGITWTDGQQNLVKERREEYYWSVEVPRLVSSGTYGLQTMLENEWIWVDDKNQIHIHDKPPHRR